MRLLAAVQGSVQGVVQPGGGGRAAEDPAQHHAQPAALQGLAGQTLPGRPAGRPAEGRPGEDGQAAGQ